MCSQRTIMGMQSFRLVHLLLSSIVFLFVFVLYQRILVTSLSAQVRNIEQVHTAPRLEDASHDPHDQQKDDIVVIYNRVPKTGSTSFMGVVYDLCGQNGYHVLHINVTKNSHILSLSDQVRFAQNVTQWQEKKPAVYHGHLAYLDFTRLGISQQPIYINIIREPLERMISYYYFLRYGDDFRPHLNRRKKGNTMTFDECVEEGLVECDVKNLWLQIPFFCGHAAECWVPGSEWALSEAKHNLVHKYLLVGVTDEISDFITLLEFALPRVFHGASAYFTAGEKSHLRKTKQKLPPSPETLNKIQQTRVWKMENEFYEFALEQFHAVKKRTLVVDSNGQFIDRGQQFKYMKVRPKPS